MYRDTSSVDCAPRELTHAHIAHCRTKYLSLLLRNCVVFSIFKKFTHWSTFYMALSVPSSSSSLHLFTLTLYHK